MNTNQLVESMLNQCQTQEKTQRWITSKQIKFLVDISINAHRVQKELVTERRWSKRIYIDTDKYEITILVSPMNGAGFLTVKNRKITENRYVDENKIRVEELKNELKTLEEEIKEDFAELKEENKMSEWHTITDKSQRQLKRVIERELKKIEEIKKEIQARSL